MSVFGLFNARLLTTPVKRDLVSVKRDLVSVERDLVSVKRDLVSVKRDLVSVKRDLVSKAQAVDYRWLLTNLHVSGLF
jgi:hypothetical protein